MKIPSDCIDFAAEHNIPYIMYDSGWYGTENDESYSPMVPYKGEFPYMKGRKHHAATCDVDIRDHLDYAEEKGGRSDPVCQPGAPGVL